MHVRNYLCVSNWWNLFKYTIIITLSHFLELTKVASLFEDDKVAYVLSPPTFIEIVGLLLTQE